MTKKQDILTAVKDLPGIKTEILGTWLWVTGETYQHKSALKAAGLFYSGKKQAWYYHEGGYRKTSKHEWSLDEIRNRFSNGVLA